MKILGFNLNKIHAERFSNFRKSNINNNIEFTNLEKEKNELIKEEDLLKLAFKYSLLYEDSEKKEKQEKAEKTGEVLFEGSLILSVTKEESKEMMKDWKKKQISKNAALPFYNFILKRCTSRSLSLQEEINLPSHLPIPQIKQQVPQESN